MFYTTKNLVLCFFLLCVHSSIDCQETESIGEDEDEAIPEEEEEEDEEKEQVSLEDETTVGFENEETSTITLTTDLTTKESEETFNTLTSEENSSTQEGTTENNETSLTPNEDSRGEEDDENESDSNVTTTTNSNMMIETESYSLTSGEESTSERVTEETETLKTEDTEGSGEVTDEENCEEEVGSGVVEKILGKCKSEETLSGAEALALELNSCSTEGMDERILGCFEDLKLRLETLEQRFLEDETTTTTMSTPSNSTSTMMKNDSEEYSDLEDRIKGILVKMKVIDCQNDTECDDDKKCMTSLVDDTRRLCESPCDREPCTVSNSLCVVNHHLRSCECKEDFHGNGSESCIPNGFTSEENGKHYKMFDNEYVEWSNASEQCEKLGARLPVLDSEKTISIVKKYLSTSNFTVFEQWDRSSRRIWLGLLFNGGYDKLKWADGQSVASYPASSRLFVWEARRLLYQEVAYADNTRHYGLYIDGDIAKLPGGGRKGAAVLCELLLFPSPTVLQYERASLRRISGQPSS